MADTPKKAAPGVEQSIPAAAEPAVTPRKRAAAKKADAVIDTAAAASPTVLVPVKKPAARKPAAPKGEL